MKHRKNKIITSIVLLVINIPPKAEIGSQASASRYTWWTVAPEAIPQALLCFSIAKVVSLKSETTDLEYITPGGLIGIGTNIDPYYCKNDNMIGMVVGLVDDDLPEVYYNITIKWINYLIIFLE